jgi:hypothetical protein
MVDARRSPHGGKASIHSTSVDTPPTWPAHSNAWSARHRSWSARHRPYASPLLLETGSSVSRSSPPRAPSPRRALSASLVRRSPRSSRSASGGHTHTHTPHAASTRTSRSTSQVSAPCRVVPRARAAAATQLARAPRAAHTIIGATPPPEAQHLLRVPTRSRAHRAARAHTRSHALTRASSVARARQPH